jgi:hypothetical protein
LNFGCHGLTVRVAEQKGVQRFKRHGHVEGSKTSKTVAPGFSSIQQLTCSARKLGTVDEWAIVVHDSWFLLP